MRFKVLFAFSMLLFLYVLAGNKKELNDVEIRMMQIPGSSTKNVNDIAAFVNSAFKTDIEKAWAVYFWIGQTVSYDVPNMYRYRFYENEQQIIDEVLKKRQGVCAHYASLFSAICNSAGVKTVVVSGITKQNGRIDPLSHAWNACYINNKWLIVDPTWGTGVIMNGKFVRKLNDDYFLMSPEKSIVQRFPFDVIWQFTDNQFDFENFEKGKFKVEKNNRPVNFNDSINAYEKLTELDKKLSTLKRIGAFKSTNTLIEEYKEHLIKDIDVIRVNASVEVYNNAINTLNQGVADLNEFINYRNQQFTPKRSDAAIKLMLENVEIAMNKYKNEVSTIKYSNSSLNYSMSESNRILQELNKAYNEQKEFLDKYLSTAKLFRKSLFYNYSLMGVPLNQKK